MNIVQKSALRHSQAHHFSKLPIALLCGLLLVGTASVQAASPTRQAAGGSVPLTLYSDKNVSFLYPKSWSKQVVGEQGGPIVMSNDQSLLTAAANGTTPALTNDQILVEVLAGTIVTNQLSQIKATGSAVDVLTTFVKAVNNSGSIYGTPEVLNLISSTDAAQVSAQDTKTKDDGLIILLSPADNPVFLVALFAPGKLAASQSLIQGIASTVQTGTALAPVATTSALSPSATLSETFTNKVYTLNYPKGWLASSPSGSPDSIYLSTDQSLIDAADKGTFSLTSGQILAGVASGSQVFGMTNSSSSNPLTPSDLIVKLKAQLVDSSSAIFSTLGQPATATIGSQPGAEASLTLKNGNGAGYVIAFYVNKKPVLVIGMIANGEAETNRATFEQIAASITFNTP